MPGITSVGAYIPTYRLPRKAFADAWGTGAAPASGASPATMKTR